MGKTLDPGKTYRIRNSVFYIRQKRQGTNFKKASHMKDNDEKQSSYSHVMKLTIVRQVTLLSRYKFCLYQYPVRYLTALTVLKRGVLPKMINCWRGPCDYYRRYRYWTNSTAFSPFPVLQIRIRIFPFRIQGQRGTWIQIFSPSQIPDPDPGQYCRYGMFIPDQNFSIPDPTLSQVKKRIPGQDRHQRI